MRRNTFARNASSQIPNSLRVTVVSARNLSSRDGMGVHPFVEGRVSSKVPPFQTSIKKYSADPEWNEEFQIDLQPIHKKANPALVLTVLTDIQPAGRDPFIGEVRIPLLESNVQMETAIEVVRLLSKKKKTYLPSSGSKLEGGAELKVILTYSSKICGNINPPLTPSSASAMTTDLSRTLGAPLKKSRFGIPLDDVLEEEDNIIPAVIIGCVTRLRERSFDVEGLFRVSALTQALDALKNEIDQAADASSVIRAITKVTDPHAVAGILKKYLRDLPESIIPFNEYDRACACVQERNTEKQIQGLCQLIADLPESNAIVLHYLCDFFVFLSKHQQKNLMGPANIAIVFGPNIIRSLRPLPPESMVQANAVLQAIVDHYPDVFKNPPPTPTLPRFVKAASVPTSLQPINLDDSWDSGGEMQKLSANAREEMEGLKQRMEELENEKTEMEAELKAVKAQLVTVTSQSQTNIQDIINKMNQEKVIAIELAKKECQQQHNEIQKERENKSGSQIQSLESEMAGHVQKMASKEGEIAEAQQQIQKQKAFIAKLQEDNHAMQMELEKANGIIEQQEIKLTSIGKQHQAQLAAATEKIQKECQLEVEKKIGSSLAGGNAEIERLMTEIERLKGEHKKEVKNLKKEYLDEKEEAFLELQQKYETEKNALMQKLAKGSSKDNEILELHEQIAELQTQLKKTKVEMEKDKKAALAKQKEALDREREEALTAAIKAHGVKMNAAVAEAEERTRKSLSQELKTKNDKSVQEALDKAHTAEQKRVLSLEADLQAERATTARLEADCAAYQRQIASLESKLRSTMSNSHLSSPNQSGIASPQDPVLQRMVEEVQRAQDLCLKKEALALEMGKRSKELSQVLTTSPPSAQSRKLVEARTVAALSALNEGLQKLKSQHEEQLRTLQKLYSRRPASRPLDSSDSASSSITMSTE